MSAGYDDVRRAVASAKPVLESRIFTNSGYVSKLMFWKEEGRAEPLQDFGMEIVLAYFHAGEEPEMRAAALNTHEKGYG
jgi:hypothetical protein